MNPEPPIFDDDDDADAAAYAEAIVELDAGLFIPHEEMVAWLKTWGKSDKKPAPE